jgi:nicotinamide riboside transporter PnuC
MTDKLKWIVWVSTILTIVAALMNTEKNYLCWVVYSISNLGFIVYFYHKREWSIIILNIFYIGINIWGLYRWLI